MPKKDTNNKQSSKKKIITIIESPYAGKNKKEIQRNVKYAKLALKDSLINYKEASFLSHLIYTRVLNDNIPAERKLGIETGFRFIEVAQQTAVYTDLWISKGMRMGIKKAKKNGNKIIYRSIWKPTELDLNKDFKV